MNMKMIVDSIGNFDFNVLLAGFNDSSHVLTQVELISLIVLGVLGIGICLTGWKFVRVWAVIFGFVSGTVGGAAAAYFAGLAVDYIWIPGLVVGVILTALSIWKKKVGGFWLCWLMTALVGVHLLKPDSVILWGVCIGVGLLVAVVFIWFSSIVTICHFHFWRYGYRKLYLLSDSCKYEMDPYCIMHSGSGTRSVDSDAHGIG